MFKHTIHYLSFLFISISFFIAGALFFEISKVRVIKDRLYSTSLEMRYLKELLSTKTSEEVLVDIRTIIKLREATSQKNAIPEALLTNIEVD